MRSVPIPTTPHFFQLAQWILDPVGYLKSNFQRYGDMFTASVQWGSDRSIILVNEPQAMQQMLTQDSGKMLNGKTFSAPGDANLILESVLGRQNVVMLSGRQHRNRRKLVMPPFHGDRLKAYGAIIQNIAKDVMAEWSEGHPINVRKAMQHITMRVILEAVFGLSQSGDPSGTAYKRYEQLENLLGTRLDMTSTPAASVIVFFPWLQKDYGDWSPGGRIRKLAEQTDRILFDEIRDRRAALAANPDSNRTDILSLLLAAKDEDGNGLTDQELHDELMTLLVAGHETTATALTWAMYWIHSQPAVKSRLLEELDGVVDPTDPSQFLQLPYLTAVCNETLRIHPVAMLTFPRRVEAETELCGYELQPGDLVMGCIYLLHQREDLYPDPHVFRPERFIERQFGAYEFMPFGAGARRCVGAALARYEMKIVLGTLLSQLDLSLVNQQSVKPARRGFTLGQNAAVQVQKVGKRSPKPLSVSI